MKKIVRFVPLIFCVSLSCAYRALEKTMTHQSPENQRCLKITAQQISNIEKNIRKGIADKLQLSIPNYNKVNKATMRQYFIAYALEKFINDVPEFLEIIAVFDAQGGFQENSIFCFEKLFAALDHGAIRIHGGFLDPLNTALAALGLTTQDIKKQEYNFVPTGKPLQANAYSAKNSPTFQIFVSQLRLDLLPENISKRIDDYIKLSYNNFDSRIKQLAFEAVEHDGLIHADALEFAHVLIDKLLSRNNNAPTLFVYDPELYYILKKATPEIFNALVFGPQLNHLALDLRKCGVERWGSGNNFRTGIDQFFDEIGKPGVYGRTNECARWNYDTLDMVQGNLAEEQIKIRQTSVKMRYRENSDNCCYIEFVIRLPIKSLTELQQDYAQLDNPNYDFETFVRQAPEYQGFHTYNATNIYTSNRTGDEFKQEKKQYDDESLRSEIKKNIEKAQQEFSLLQTNN